jgi:hypothetical protein
MTAAEEDELLIIALAPWGLRANEVAGLHVDKIERATNDVPCIAFDDRKNGPGGPSPNSTGLSLSTTASPS